MNKRIDWEQRRYEIAKAISTEAMRFTLNTNIEMFPKGMLDKNVHELAAIFAVKYADALIKELKM